MAPSSSDSRSDATSASLLFALRADPGGAVWEDFVARYSGLIRRWCRSWGLQDSDCDDVSQEVLLSLSQAMKKFQYDPNKSFRAWLKTTTRNAWTAYAKRHNKPGAGSGATAPLSKLHSLEACDDLAQALEAQYDAELMQMASLRVQMKVKPRTWQAFYLTAIAQRSGAEAAAELGMKVAHVYVAKSEVIKALREEVMKLDPT